MDPQAALDQAEVSLRDGEPIEALSYILEYLFWRVRGGFEPPGGDRRAQELAWRAIDTVND